MDASDQKAKLQARAQDLRRMAAKSPFKKDRERFSAMAAEHERRAAGL